MAVLRRRRRRDRNSGHAPMRQQGWPGLRGLLAVVWWQEAGIRRRLQMPAAAARTPDPGRVFGLRASGGQHAQVSTAGSATDAARTLRHYAFDINNGATDPGYIPAPGTNPKVFSHRGELIINDQLTAAHRAKGGYPIVGRDARRVHPDQDPREVRGADPGERRRHRRVQGRQPDRARSRPLRVTAAPVGCPCGHRRNRPLRWRGGHRRNLVCKELQGPELRIELMRATTAVGSTAAGRRALVARGRRT